MATSIEILCGEQKVDLPESPPGCAGKYCERSFRLYIPPTVCEKKEDLDLLPTVFAIHCFGCTYEIFQFWEGIAENFNFVLVIPEGIEKSFNGRHCCGWPVRENVDDRGYLKHVLDVLDERFSFISSEWVYGVGISNGGFMVTYAAEMFRAIAAISGHQYDLSYLSSSGRSIAAIFHHGSLDDAVRPEGCCTDPSMPICCCGITNDSPATCTPVMKVFEKWAVEVNKCGTTSSATGGAGDNNGLIDITPRILETVDSERNLQCYEAIDDDCLAVTKFCMHIGETHFLYEYTFASPMSDEIADFFAQDACVANGGTWSSVTRICSCAQGETGDVTPGTYCMTSTTSASLSRQTSLQILSDTTPLSSSTTMRTWPGLVVFVSLLIVPFLRKLGKKHMSSYTVGCQSTSSDNPKTTN